jgi:hypothetical protein
MKKRNIMKLAIISTALLGCAAQAFPATNIAFCNHTGFNLRPLVSTYFGNAYDDGPGTTIPAGKCIDHAHVRLPALAAVKSFSVTFVYFPMDNNNVPWNNSISIQPKTYTFAKIESGSRVHTFVANPADGRNQIITSVLSY